jgi:hypothetical protein
MYYNKFLKYKFKYNEKIKDNINNSYKKINNVLDKLDKAYYEIKEVQRSKPKVLTQRGGRMKEYDEHKIKKYKTFIKSAKSNILYYKNMAEQYYMTSMSLNSQYIKLFNILKSKKEEIGNMYDKIGILNTSNANNKDKLQLLETTMSLLENTINSNSGVNLNIETLTNGKSIDTKIKNFTCKTGGGIGAEWTMETFKDKLNISLSKAKTDMNDVNEDNKWVSEKVTKIFEKLNSFVTQTDKLKVMSTNIAVSYTHLRAHET